MKRPATETQGLGGQSFSKSQALENGTPSRRSNPQVDPEMGDFEDDWEDEVEEDVGVTNAEADDEDGNLMLAIYLIEANWRIAMDVDVEVTQAAEDGDAPEPEADVYLPGTHTLGQDEVLEPDQSVYEMLHRMNVAWPCLSFDILRDSLGDERRRYPATTYVVTGTQADVAKSNEVIVMKMSQLHKTQKDGGKW